VPNTASKVMGRQPCCDKLGVKKGPWTVEEDKKLVNFILTHGQCCWRAVPKLAGLRRCGKSCRLRWTNYLRPDLKRGLLTEDEEQLVIDLHARLGNRCFFFAAYSLFVIFINSSSKVFVIMHLFRTRYLIILVGFFFFFFGFNHLMCTEKCMRIKLRQPV
jgi:hypothetical protein